MMKKYLLEERGILLFEIDSILRWDKVTLTWFQHKVWLFIRWIVVRMTDIIY